MRRVKRTSLLDARVEQLEFKQFLDCIHRRGSPGASNRSGQRYALGAHGDAILGVAAHLKATFRRERIQALAGVHSAGRVHVEEHYLADGRGTDEAAIVLGIFASGKLRVSFPFALTQLHLEILRTCFQAAATGHALAQRIGLLLHRRRNCAGRGRGRSSHRLGSSL